MIVILCMSLFLDSQPLESYFVAVSAALLQTSGTDRTRARRGSEQEFAQSPVEGNKS